MHVELQHLFYQTLPFLNQSWMVNHIPFVLVFEEDQLILDVLVDPLAS